jgi:hypothetical protein
LSKPFQENYEAQIIVAGFALHFGSKVGRFTKTEISLSSRFFKEKHSSFSTSNVAIRSK